MRNKSQGLPKNVVHISKPLEIIWKEINKKRQEEQNILKSTEEEEKIMKFLDGMIP